MKTLYNLFINGEWIRTVKEMKVLDKYSGSIVGTVSVADENDVERAIVTACDSFPEMSELSAYRRAEILTQIAGGIKERAEEIAEVIAREAGKAWKYAIGEVNRCVETFTFAAGEARTLHGETVPMDASTAGEGRFGFWIREPVGVVVAISPFNFPLNLVAHKVAPAIAAGCPVVLKPASWTPITALLLAEIIEETDLPKGAFNVVIGGGSTVGKQLVTDPRPAKVTFTGSPPVGLWIKKNCGMKKVTLELGSNSGVIIDIDADLDLAVERCLMGAFANSGQVCISVQRIYLHEKIAKEFTDKFLNGVKKLKIGNPLEKDTDVGPMIDPAEVERVELWIEDAVSTGAEVLAGGNRINNRVFSPTVLNNVSSDMKVVKDEVFGPVVSFFTFVDISSAISELDRSQYGLQAGIFTKQIDHAMKAIKRINVGGIMINDVPTFRVDHMPYGGNKLSGIGREGLRFAIEEMTQIKMVCIKL